MELPTPAPVEVQEISGLFLKMRLDRSFKPEIPELLSKTDNFKKYIERLYREWFPSAKSYSSEHIAEHLFVISIPRDEYLHYIKYEICALLGTLIRLADNISQMTAASVTDERVGDELSLLGEVVSEAIQFIDSAHFYVKGAKANWGHFKRGQAKSVEIFNASLMLLRGKIYSRSIGEFVIQPTSVFLIRQAIDVRLKNAFAIRYISDKSGAPLPISWSFLLEIIKDNPTEIQFPMKSSILLKIHNWTQRYIHLGEFPFIWEIDFAHQLLEPIFNSAEHRQKKADGGQSMQWSMFGSIKMMKTFFARIEDKVKEKLKDKCPEGFLIKRLNGEPEALLVDNLDQDD